MDMDWKSLISQTKSKVLMFNVREKPEKVANLEVVNEIRYPIGVTVTDRKRLFEKHKREMNVRMNRMMNMTSCVIEKSVNRVLIGKTYWKNMVLPSVLYASSVMDFTKDEIEKMQVYENSVMRRMLRARSYSPVCALRGEVGASLMMTRIMKERLNYENSLCCDRNLLLKEIYIEICERKSGWSVVIRKYRKEVGLSEGWEGKL